MGAAAVTRGRWFFDVSYTRTQRVTVGITRTVRRLQEELQALQRAQGCDMAAVSFHSGGFRKIRPALHPPQASPGQLDRDGESYPARLFRWITGTFFRKLVVLSLFLPWPILRALWTKTSSWTFNALSRADATVEFRPGDVLLLCDASWNYRVSIAASKARAQGATVAVLVYDLIPVRHPEFCYPLVPRIFSLWLHEIMRCSDALICISKATEDDLQSYAEEMGWQLPQTRHLRLGGDPSRQAVTGTPRAQLEQFFDTGAECFAAIGSIEPKKNYAFLLEVFEGLWAKGVATKLLVIGRATAECEELVQKLRRHPEQGRCLLTLFDASDAEVAFAYANSRALLFPSLAEGFGLPLVEARTRGCRVIASDLPVFIELADDGVSFYPRHSATALEALIMEYRQPERLRETSPMPAFTWQDSALQFSAIVSQLTCLRGRA